MRWLGILSAIVVLGWASIASACSDHPEIKVRVTNDTDSSLSWCYTRRGTTEIGVESCEEITPHYDVEWGLLCHENTSERMVMIIRLKTGVVLHQRDALCSDWADATIKIERQGQDYVVTDGLTPTTTTNSN